MKSHTTSPLVQSFNNANEKSITQSIEITDHITLQSINPDCLFDGSEFYTFFYKG